MTKYNKFKCAIYLIINEALYGVSDYYSSGYTWIGTDGLRNLGNEAIDKLGEDKEILNNIGKIDKPKDIFEQTDGFLKTLNPTDPEFGLVTNPKGEGNINIKVFDRLTDGDCSFVKKLKLEVENFKNIIVPALRGFINGAGEASTSDTLNEARSALETVKDFNGEIKDIKDDIYKYLDYGKTGFNWTRFGLLIYYALVISFIGLIFLGSVPVIMCSSKCCRCVNNLGCVLIMIFVVLGFLVTTILFLVSVMIIEGCDLIKPKNLKDDRGIIPSSVWDEIKICLVGNGDLYSEKGLGESLKFADESTEGLRQITLIYDPDAREMKYPVADEIIEEFENIAYKQPYLANTDIFPTGDLNLGTVSTRDTIKWSGCDDPDPVVYPQYLETVSSICIPITACNAATNRDAIKNRYGNTHFADKLIRYIEFANDVKKEMKKALNKIKRGSTDSYYYNMDTDTLSNGVKNVAEKANEMKDITLESMRSLGPELKDRLNCTFMQGSFTRIHDSFCGDFTQQVTFTALSMGLISSISLLLVITMVCINRRFYPPRRGDKDYKIPNDTE